MKTPFYQIRSAAFINVHLLIVMPTNTVYHLVISLPFCIFYFFYVAMEKLRNLHLCPDRLNARTLMTGFCLQPNRYPERGWGGDYKAYNVVGRQGGPSRALPV